MEGETYILMDGWMDGWIYRYIDKWMDGRRDICINGWMDGWMYRYIDKWMDGRKEGNILFNDTLNTFYLRLYGIRHTVKEHSDSERENLLPSHGLLFPISSKGSAWYVLSCLWDGAYKRTLAVNQKE